MIVALLVLPGDISGSAASLTAATAGTAGPNALSPLRLAGHSAGSELLREAQRSLDHAAPSGAHPGGICHGDGAVGGGACRTERLLASRAALAANPSSWRQAGGTPPPQSAYDFELTYDAFDGYVLLLGSPAGAYGAPSGNDTWIYRSGNWSPLYTAPSPENCPGSSLSYDDADGYVVYLASGNSPYGAGACASAGQTWTFRGGSWTELYPTASPSERYGASMTNDSGDGYLLLFGGRNSSCPNGGLCNDTWEFSAGQWVEVFPSHPPSARADAGFAYDAIDGYVVLFGGSSNNVYAPLNDTWRYTAGVWTKLHPSQSPPVPQPDAFTYDASDRAVIYTNAYNWSSYSSQTEITWAFQGGNWSPVSFSTGPRQRLDAATAYDAVDGYLLMFGGAGFTDLSDTWSLHSSIWTNLTRPEPSPRLDASMTYDPTDGYVLLFGGVTCPSSVGSCSPRLLNDSWTFAGGRWTLLQPTTFPTPRDRAGMVYDATDGYVLLFGGGGASGALNDSWEFKSGAWTQLSTNVAPSPRSGQGLVYDEGDGFALLFGGDSLRGTPFANGYRDTWTFRAGTWSNVTASSALAPPASSTNPLAYDSADGYVLLFGTFQATVPGYSWSTSTSQTWGFAGGTWTNLTARAGTAPPSRTGGAMMGDPHDGLVVMFGGSGAGALTWLGDTWAFQNGSWLEGFPPVAPPNRSGAVFTYDPSLTGGVLLGGTNSEGSGVPGLYGPGCLKYVCSDEWTWTRAPASQPSVRSFTASPSTLDVGTLTTIVANVTDSHLPLSYQYAGLPAGCPTADSASLRCKPAVTGNFTIALNVTDSAGNSSGAILPLRVVPGPSLVSFNATPSRLVLGNQTVLQSVVTGGVSPYSYAYAGLPAGCASQDAARLPCTPLALGIFAVNTTVTDADAVVTVAVLSLVVTSAGAVGRPQVTTFSVTPPAVTLGTSTSITAVATGGHGALSYTYTGLPTPCGTADQSQLACVPGAAGTYSIQLTVTDALGESTTLATGLMVYPVTGGGGLVIRGFVPQPDPVYPGESTAFLVNATGGAGPLAYGYSGLPSGCGSLNTSVLPCTPGEVGTFSVWLTVSDSGGDSARARCQLVVGAVGVAAPLVLASFWVDPSPLQLGGTTVLVANWSGGVGPFRFNYSGLPPGCASANAPALTCTPSRTGEYSVGVRVTDASGEVVNGSASLEVLPSAGAAPITGGSDLGGAGWVAIAATGVLGALIGAAVRTIWPRRRPRDPPA
ncbi:MAG: kelch motif-containing protein [Thermoplasmata archaeon]|nr:kelch motif-containing protein [Thermoplasmata archaeon]